MSENGKNMRSYSTQDIQNYLEGKLSPQEMHAIEKAALEDPFLADAIEGMEIHRKQSGEKSFGKDLEELQNKLHERTGHKRDARIIPLMRTWQAAAAVIILLGATMLTYLFIIRNEKPKENIAVTNEKKTNDSVKRQTEPEELNRKVSGNSANDSSSGNQPSVQSESTAARKSRSRDEAKPAAPASRIEPLTSSAKQVPDSIQKSSASVSAPAKTERVIDGKAAGFEMQESSVMDHHFIEGKVLDPRNEPIAGATVRMKNKKNATVTDSRGHFKLDIGREDHANAVEIASVGYNSRSAVLDTGSNANIIQLQPNSTALNEVTVSGFSNQKKDEEADDEDSSDKKIMELKPKSSVSKLKVEPSIGWTAYNLYLDKNKKISTADSTIRGAEIVSFQVSQKGELSSFIITKSLSPAHDAEAIRLIKQGPSWKLLKGKTQKATVTINF